MVQGLSASRPGFYQNDSKGPRRSACASGQLATGPGSPRITWKQSACKSIGLCLVPTFFFFLGQLSFSRLLLLLSGTGVRNHLLEESSPSFCVSSVMRIKQPLSTGSPQLMREQGRPSCEHDCPTSPPPMDCELREHQFTFQLLGRQMRKLRPRGKEENEKSREALGSPPKIEGRLIKRKELSENLNILQICLC